METITLFKDHRKIITYYFDENGKGLLYNVYEFINLVSDKFIGNLYGSIIFRTFLSENPNYRGYMKLKYTGDGQIETPVMDIYQLKQLLFILPGEIINKYRDMCVNIQSFDWFSMTEPFITTIPVQSDVRLRLCIDEFIQNCNDKRKHIYILRKDKNNFNYVPSEKDKIEKEDCKHYIISCAKQDIGEEIYRIKNEKKFVYVHTLYETKNCIPLHEIKRQTEFIDGYFNNHINVRDESKLINYMINYETE